MAEKDTDSTAVEVEEKEVVSTPKKAKATPKESKDTASVAKKSVKPKAPSKPRVKAVAKVSTAVEDSPTVVEPELDIANEPLIPTPEAVEPVHEPLTEEEKLRKVFGEDATIVDDPKSIEDEAVAESAAFADEVYENADEEVLYATNGTILAPGYWQAWAGKNGRLNVFAWLGVIFAVFFFPLGFLFSALGYVNQKQVLDDKFHKVMSYVGMGLSSFFAFILIVPFVFTVIFRLVSYMLAPFMW